MRFHGIIPILYSSDVEKSLNYYVNVLGFENCWKWGNPPTFGGVYTGDLRIYFAKEGQGKPGTWIAIDVDDVDSYHERIRANGAKILQAPTSFEWGIREMTVQDPDGHFIRFGHAFSDRKKSEKQMPEGVKIIARVPTASELRKLVTAVGWSQPEEAAEPEIPLTSIAYTVVAEDSISEKIVGCAFLLTDSAGFYYVKNVIVHPDWQGKQIGTAMMNDLVRWLNENAPDKAMASLHTGAGLTGFYRQFGFYPAFSMQMRIKR
jgi:predicted enzyme related to lactoylglutathione lyase/GNAT superfamily N-acetyltransferase